MRSLGKRWHLLRRLIKLQCGPGAAVLPPTVSRIHMDFGRFMAGGHMGARKFWQENLPRLKYHNPNVPMIVNRHTIQDQTPIMTIYFRDPDSADAASTIDLKTQPGSSRTNLSKAQPPAPGERVVHIDMKEKHSSIILEHFMSETRAVPLAPTGEEIAEMQDLDAMAVQAVKDQGRVKALRDERKREEEMLKRARQVGVGDEDS